MLLGVDGISDFNGLHSRKYDYEVQFYAFDILAHDGEDLRSLPLHLRKNNIARLLARRINGIFLADFEQGEIGPDLFRHACLLGLEGLVSKHRDRPTAQVDLRMGQVQEPKTSRNGTGEGLTQNMTVWIYVHTRKQVGDKHHLKVFASEDIAETWFEESDPESVAFEYEVLE